MGVIKNEVGRPSNKTKKIRMVLKLVGVLVVITLAVFLGYYIKDNEKKIVNNKIDNNDSNNNSIKELDVNSDLVVNLFDKYNLYDSEMIFTAFDGEVIVGLNYFYENKLTNDSVLDIVKFIYSVGNLYTNYDNSGVPSFSLSENDTISLDEVNMKSKELFGSNINIDNILKTKNQVNGSIYGNDFNYNHNLKTFSISYVGVGGASDVEKETKIINAYKENNKLIIENKVMFIYEIPEFEDVLVKILKSEEYYEDYKGENLLDEIKIDNYKGENLLDKIKIDDYLDKLDTFKWIFKDDGKGNYTFESVEKVK